MRQGLLTLLLVPVFAVFAACSRGGDDVEPTATSIVSGRTPVPTVPSNVTDFDISMSDIALSHTADWRVAEQTESSISFTPRNDPASAVLTLQWSPSESTTNVVADFFLAELELAASEVQELDDIRIGGVTARRFASIVGSGAEQRAVIHVIFVTRGNAYLATFSATPQAFPEYAARAEALIAELQPR